MPPVSRHASGTLRGVVMGLLEKVCSLPRVPSPTRMMTLGMGGSHIATIVGRPRTGIRMRVVTPGTCGCLASREAEPDAEYITIHPLFFGGKVIVHNITSEQALR